MFKCDDCNNEYQFVGCFICNRKDSDPYQVMNFECSCKKTGQVLIPLEHGKVKE